MSDFSECVIVIVIVKTRSVERQFSVTRSSVDIGRFWRRTSYGSRVAPHGDVRECAQLLANHRVSRVVPSKASEGLPTESLPQPKAPCVPNLTSADPCDVTLFFTDWRLHAVLHDGTSDAGSCEVLAEEVI